MSPRLVLELRLALLRRLQFENDYAIYFFRLRLRQFQNQPSLDDAEFDAASIAQEAAPNETGRGIPARASTG